MSKNQAPIQDPMCWYPGHNWMTYKTQLVFLLMLLTTQPCLTAHPAAVFTASPLSEFLKTLAATTGSLPSPPPPLKHDHNWWGCSSDILKFCFNFQSFICIHLGQVYGPEEHVQTSNMWQTLGVGVGIVSRVSVMVTYTCDVHVNLEQCHCLMVKWRNGSQYLK